MSRSYRKYPCVWYEKIDKKLAARQFRRSQKNIAPDELCQGSNYKKYNRTGDWNACRRWTKEEAIENYCLHQSIPAWRCLNDNFPTIDDYLRYWYKCAKGK